MPRDIIEAALAYVENGWSVIALHSNTDEGCTCGNARCRTPGKHPRTDLSGRGVLSATRSREQIGKWPEGINIGIALGRRVLAIDVDDPDMAAKFLAPAFGLAQETGLVASGRGCHIYFKTKEETRTFNLKTKRGREVGQVRGVGAYVVAPPSMSSKGTLYQWIGLQRGTWVPPNIDVTDDPLQYAVRLFSQIDVALIDDFDSLVGFDGEVPSGALKAIPLPKRFHAGDGMLLIRQACDGNLPAPLEGQRSGFLYRIGAKVTTVAREGKISLSRVELAGIIKQADEKCIRKLAGDVEARRRSQAAADKECYRIAYKLLDADYTPSVPDGDTAQKPSDATDAAKPTDAASTRIASQAAPPRGTQYYFDRTSWMMYFQPNPAKPRDPHPIANFDVRITAEVTIDKGSDQPVETAWGVKLSRQDGSALEFLLTSREKEHTSSFERAINRHLTAVDIVYPKMYEKLKTAMQVISKSIGKDIVFARTGWVQYQGQRYYILPSMVGGIGRKMEPAVRIDFEVLEDENISDADLAGYGQGVRIPTSKRERDASVAAFMRLVACGKTSVTWPIVLQVMAGPLYTAGVDEVPPLLHVMGATGSLKTSYSKAALSIFGTFKESDGAPASWGSTANANKAILHALGDVTTLIDDYKASHVDKQAVTRIIQPYADKTSRRRLTPRQRLQSTEKPRGLILSNGEDVWEAEASIAARTVVIELDARDIHDKHLEKVQGDVAHGLLPRFGGLWLSWLARHPSLFDDREVEASRRIWLESLRARTEGGEMHRRLLASLSTLCAVGDVVVRFIKSVAPARVDLITRWQGEMVETFLAKAAEIAEEVESLSPLRQLADLIRSEMAAGRAAFRPVQGISASHRNYPDIPSNRVAIVGWHDDASAFYLSREATFGYYKEVIRRRGDVPSFGWKSIMQELKNGRKIDVTVQRWVATDDQGGKTQLRVAEVNSKLFGGEEDSEV